MQHINNNLSAAPQAHRKPVSHDHPRHSQLYTSPPTSITQLIQNQNTRPQPLSHITWVQTGQHNVELRSRQLEPTRGKGCGRAPSTPTQTKARELMAQLGHSPIVREHHDSGTAAKRNVNQRSPHLALPPATQPVRGS